MRDVAKKATFLIWLALLTWLSLINVKAASSWLSGIIPYQDKVIHFGVYSFTAFLGAWAFSAAGDRDKRLLSVAVACILWSVGLEVLQYVMGRGRHFEVLDIIANIIGCFAGVAAYRFILKKQHYGS